MTHIVKCKPPDEYETGKNCRIFLKGANKWPIQNAHQLVVFYSQIEEDLEEDDKEDEIDENGMPKPKKKKKKLKKRITFPLTALSCCICGQVNENYHCPTIQLYFRRGS